MDISVDADGDPVVMLPDAINSSGLGNSILSFGASYALAGAGGRYHSYQLVVKAGSGSLYVNGAQVLTGYTGNSSFVSDAGMVFTVNSGRQANYNLSG